MFQYIFLQKFHIANKAQKPIFTSLDCILQSRKYFQSHGMIFDEQNLYKSIYLQLLISIIIFYSQ